MEQVLKSTDSTRQFVLSGGTCTATFKCGINSQVEILARASVAQEFITYDTVHFPHTKEISYPNKIIRFNIPEGSSVILHGNFIEVSSWVTASSTGLSQEDIASNLLNGGGGSTISSGKIHYMSDNGALPGDAVASTAALEAIASKLSSGDTIVVDGDYTLNNTIYFRDLDNISIEGGTLRKSRVSGVWANYDNNGDIISVVPQNDGTNEYLLIFINCNDTKLSFKGVGATPKDTNKIIAGEQLIYFNSCTRSRIIGSVFEDVGDAVVRSQNGGYAGNIDINDPLVSEGLIITGCTFDNVHQISTNPTSSRNVVIVGNIFNNLVGSVKMTSRRAGTKNILISSNLFIGSKEYCISLSGAEGATIKGNFMCASEKGLVTITRNSGSSSTSGILQLEPVDMRNFDISNNTLEDVKDVAIYVQNAYADETKGYTDKTNRATPIESLVVTNNTCRFAEGVAKRFINIFSHTVNGRTAVMAKLINISGNYIVDGGDAQYGCIKLGCNTNGSTVIIHDNKWFGTSAIKIVLDYKQNANDRVVDADEPEQNSGVTKKVSIKGNWSEGTINKDSAAIQTLMRSAMVEELEIADNSFDNYVLHELQDATFISGRDAWYRNVLVVGNRVFCKADNADNVFQLITEATSEYRWMFLDNLFIMDSTNVTTAPFELVGVPAELITDNNRVVNGATSIVDSSITTKFAEGIKTLTT